MIKKLLVILLILLSFGCSSISKENELYLSYIDKLNNINKSSKDYPFNLEVTLDRLNDNIIRYQVVLDNVREDLNDISMIITHDKKTSDAFPSIGIFDSKEDLKVKSKPSGIVLAGFIKYSGDIKKINTTFKVLVKYKIKNKSYEIHYVTKK